MIAVGRIRQQPICHQQLARLAISWATYARRPLTIEELQHAIAVHMGENPLNRCALRDAQTMIIVCCGLLIFDKETSVIRLVHYSTKQFFEQMRWQWFRVVEDDLAKTCVRYLLFDVFLSGRCESACDYRKRLSVFKLYSYAAKHWGHHVRAASNVCDEVIVFLQSIPKVDASTQPLFNDHENLDRGDNSPLGMTGLHLAAFFGLNDSIVRLLNLVNIDRCDDMLRTPLSYAAMNGHHITVHLLLEKGADKEMKEICGQTPLSCAAGAGWEMATNAMLMYGADVNTADDDDMGDGYTPLILAAEKGHEKVANLLVRYGANLHLQDNQGYTALLRAAESGHGKLIKLLVSHGANANSTNGALRTALSYACEQGREDIARYLLDNKADYSIKDDHDLTALSYAAKADHKNIVRLLSQLEARTAAPEQLQEES